MRFKEVFKYILMVIDLLCVSHVNVVVSESMEPTLHRGDLIIVDHNVENLQVGDIIVYHAIWTSQPEDVVHRIVQKQQKGANITYRTKGDNHITNPGPDPQIIQPRQIETKIINLNNQPLVIPNVGYINLWIRGL